MNDNLFKAIYTLYSTTIDFNTATNGQFDDKAQSSWNDNFAYYKGLDAQKADTFRTKIDDVNFQINVFSSTKKNCWALFNKCLTLFDGKILTITGHYPSRISREYQVLPLWNEAENLYQATAEFTILVQQT